MKKLVKSIYLVLCISCIYSCAPSEVDVYFPADFVKENEVIINGEHNLADHAGEQAYSSIKIPKGKLSVSINGETKEVSTRKGGLLNLNGEEFVVYSIFYSSNANQKDPGGIPIVVDSIAYFNKNSVFMRLPEDQRIRQAQKIGMKSYDASKANNFNTGVVRKQDFFAEKGWDLDINDEIPEEMTVRTSGSKKNASATKTILLRAAVFKLQAMLSDEYWTVDLRESTPVTP